VRRDLAGAFRPALEESERIMPKASCHSCVYAYWDPGLWLRTLQSGFPARPFCANQSDTPGREQETPSGGVCRNYRPRPADPDTTDGTVKRIPVTGGLWAYVDAADFDWLNRYTWHMMGGGYAGRHENGKKVFMHRQIMKPPKGKVVDHIHGNRLDNTRANLHNCTPAENNRNRAKHRHSASRYFGVYREKKKTKWEAVIYFKGKNRHIGYFADEIEAARAYDRKAAEWLGPAARLNFPDEAPAGLTEGKKVRTKQGKKIADRRKKRSPGRGKAKQAQPRTTRKRI
jgi:hypothetical protein